MPFTVPNSLRTRARMSDWSGAPTAAVLSEMIGWFLAVVLLNHAPTA